MTMTKRGKHKWTRGVAEDIAAYAKLVRERNRLDETLLLLSAAMSDAVEMGLDPWQFAIEFATLADIGLTTADLRWLALKGIVEHAIEHTSPGQYERIFDHEVGPTTLGRGTCVTLTPLGVRVAEQVRGTFVRHGRRVPSQARRPVWKQHIRELRLGTNLVKRYRVHAPNQEIILAAFQDECWPDRIDDPLPLKPGRRQKRTLHDAIRSLNSSQINPLLRFFSDGTGRGICWHILREEIEPDAAGS